MGLVAFLFCVVLSTFPSQVADVVGAWLNIYLPDSWFSNNYQLKKEKVNISSQSTVEYFKVYWYNFQQKPKCILLEQ